MGLPAIQTPFFADVKPRHTGLSKMTASPDPPSMEESEVHGGQSTAAVRPLRLDESGPLAESQLPEGATLAGEKDRATGAETDGARFTLGQQDAFAFEGRQLQQ